MKAIIAEINKRHMIAITEKGDFVKVKRKISAGIGDEIELKPHSAAAAYRRLAAAAACFMAVVFMTTGVYAYYTPYSYVSMDINPSVALTLNRFDRVIAVEPLTEDAVTLLEDAKGLKNQELDTAVTEIIKSASKKGYINPESQNQVVLVVSTKDLKEEGQLIEQVSTAASGELAKVSKDYDVMIEKTSVSNYKAAVSNKVSPGKEILADKLKEVMPELKDEEIMSMSVKEVAKLIKEGRKALMTEERNRNGNKDDEDDEKDSARNNGKGEGNGNGSGKAATQGKDNKGNPGNVNLNGDAASNEGGAKGPKGGKAAVTGNIEDDDNGDKDKDERYREDKGKGKETTGNPNGQNNSTNGRKNNQNGDDDDDEKNNGDTEKGKGNNKNGTGKDKGGKNDD